MVVRLLFVSVFKPPGASLAGGVEAFACVITSALTGASFLKVVPVQQKLGRDGGCRSATVSTFALRLPTSSYIAILNDLLSWTVGCCFTCSSATCARARSVRGRFDHQVLRGPFWATCGMGLSVEQRTSRSPAGHRPARVRGRVLGARE